MALAVGNGLSVAVSNAGPEAGCTVEVVAENAIDRVQGLLCRLEQQHRVQLVDRPLSQPAAQKHAQPLAVQDQMHIELLRCILHVLRRMLAGVLARQMAELEHLKLSWRVEKSLYLWLEFGGHANHGPC